jgi:putative tricarboxylic transport membrane protein
VKLLALPGSLLTAGILIFATLGVWSISRNIFDVLLAFGAGLVGFIFQRSGFPIAPIILGSVLGPLLELQFRRAVSFSSGDMSVFVSRPASAVILGLSAVALFVPMILRMRTRRRLASTASGG